MKSEEAIATETIEELNAISEIRTSYMSAKASVREILIFEHEHNITESRLQLDRVSAATDHLLKVGDRPDQQLPSEVGEREASIKIHEYWQTLRVKYAEILESRTEESSPEIPAILLAEAENIEEPFESLVNRRLATESAELIERREILLALGESSANIFYIQAALAVMASIAIGAIISRSITKPIHTLMHATHRISEGKFDVQLADQGDEIGELSRSFDGMKERVRLTNENLNKLVASRTKELESANVELRRKDQIKDEFISIASHELRTPVHPILELAEAAKEGLISHEEAWELIFKHAKRLQRLTNAILDVSRIESGEVNYTFNKISVNDIIRNVISQTSGGMSIDLQIELKLGEEIVIDGDRDRLFQLFANIIENAKRFTKRGKIRIESTPFPERNRVEIKFNDTGTGISADILPRIFGKFVTSGDSGGTGLGLFISKAIVTAHAGEILAHNNEQGGATFTIRLPIRKEVPN